MFNKKEEELKSNIRTNIEDSVELKEEDNLPEVENKEEKEEEAEKNEEVIEKNQKDILEEENKKIKETLMRALAELENTRRIANEEREKTAKYAISKFAEDLINVMENFYLAFDNIAENDLSDSKKVKNFYEGIKMTQGELKKAFEKNNLVRIYPLNEDFNPDLHNAITQLKSDLEEGKIVQVMQAGYKIQDRLLRPALVAVSSGKQ
jgi:molecular chaperone GrpE